MSSALVQRDHFRSLKVGGPERRDLAQEARRHVPLLTIVGNDCHRLLVVTRQHTLDRVNRPGFAGGSEP